jgi:AcrR family transcriptional regulator
VVDAEGEEGRRERRKRLTRQAISAVAMRLFTERGFDAVTVTEIAEAADVSEKTVYNYFPHKAALFFDEGDQLLAELLFMLRARAVGQSALDAVQSFVVGRAEWAADRRPARPTPQFRRLIAGSAALQAARRQMFARYEAALAAQLAAETGAAPGSAEPFVAAVALVAVLRAAFEATTDGRPSGRDETAAALHLLCTGLGGYAVATGR